MTWKQIEASREIRLWVKEIVVPVVVTGATVYAAFPEAREFVKAKASNIKEKIKTKTKKKEGSA